MIHSNLSFGFVLLLIICSPSLPFAQTNCDSTTYIKRLGSSTSVERGLSLAYAPLENAIYIAGSKDDSLSIIKINAADEIVWIRNFDIVKQKGDHPHKIIVDSEGMIVIAGTAGQFNVLGEVFALRYNPFLDEIIWARRYLSYVNCFNHGLEELTPGSHFIMSNNPSVPGNNDEQLLMLDRQTGNIIPESSFHIELGDSDALNDLILHEGFLYGNGRYTDGTGFRDMRSTTTKIDPATGESIWTLLGHVPGSASARLYGAGMIIDQGEIFSLSVGDENGTSIVNTDIWIQKTSLDGEVEWMNKYDLPGTNDWIDEIISSNGGFVVLASARTAPGFLYLFKIDRDGNLLWAKSFDLAQDNFSLILGGLQGPLGQIGDHLYFTAFSEQGNDEDMVLVKTDLNGNVADSCGFVSDAQITVTPVINPFFYFVDPEVFDYNPVMISESSLSVQNSMLPVHDLCHYTPQILDSLSIRICQGDIYEGYTSSGVYTDHFTTLDGCDSVRVLTLDVSSVQFSSIQATICAGQVLEGYNTQGVYIDTFTGQNGCDSSRTLELFVLDTIRYVIDTTICLGESVEGYSVPGIYADAFIAINGCDSLRVLALTVQDHFESFLEIRICQGESFEGYTTSGLYTDTFVSIGGCDSIRTLQLEVGQVSETAIEASLCAGKHFEEYTTTGTYQDTFENVYGCDSIRTLELIILDPPVSYLKVSVCDEAATGYHTPGIYLDTLLNADGCDSLRTLEVENNVIYVPNVFSPNNDGVNDYFEIKAHPDVGMVPVYFAIFDRMGNMAYQRESDIVKWDGRDKSGKLYNPGVFTWILKWECQQEVKQLAGDVTLIR